MSRHREILREETPTVTPAPEPISHRAAIKTAFCIVLLLCIIPLWRLLMHMLLNIRISQKDPNRAVISIWRCSKRVSRFGVQIPPEIQNCAEKAFFSAHGISPKEYLSCNTILKNTIREAYAQLSPARKFCFKYLWGLI